MTGSFRSFFGCISACLPRSERDRPQPHANGTSDFLEQSSPSHTKSTHMETTINVPPSTQTHPQPLPMDHANNLQVTMMHVDVDARVDADMIDPAQPSPPSTGADSIVPLPPPSPAPDMHPMIGHPVKLKRNIFALIIGIDDYSSCAKLRGAVADARSFQAYLEHDLQIPKDQITTLFDGQATRKAIIQAFKDLQNNERIKENDPIVIFFAGHGGELPCPLPWVPLGNVKIQCLVPQDYDETNSEYHPIPDRTIGALIDKIAKEKGDNICVVLDCCHSASGTRVKNEAYTPRTANLKCMIRADIDQHIWSRVGKNGVGFARRGLQSHVLYAACGEKELAYEHQGRGLFTTELLKTFRGNAMEDLTYAEVLERLQRVHFVSQNPHCEGVNQHRVIFDVKTPAGRQVRHFVRADESGNFTFGAGLAHGIGRGVEFSLYSNEKQAVGEIEVDETSVIEDFLTTVTPANYPVNASFAFAKVRRVGNLPIFPAPGGDSLRILEKTMQRMKANDDVLTFRLVKTVEEAKLEVNIESGLAVLRVLDERLKRFGMKAVVFNMKVDYLIHALEAAAHYYWYLGLTKENELVDTDDGVVVDFYQLEESEEEYSLEDGLPLLVPVKGPGYRTKDVNASGTIDVIDFVVEKERLYGIKVTNNTKRDLYVNAFLFNNSSLSIARYYTQSVGMGKPDPPLKRNGTFTMGYGPGGTAPFEYSLNDSQDIDVGYLKLFFATRPIDLSDVEQVSPFTNTGGLAIEDGRKAKLKVTPVMMPSVPTDVWFTLDVPVVQRRHPKADV